MNDTFSSPEGRQLRAYEIVTLSLVTPEWKSALDMGANEVGLMRLRKLGFIEEKDELVKTFKNNKVMIRLFRLTLAGAENKVNL